MISADDRIADVVRKIPSTENVFKDYKIKVFGWGSLAKYHIGDVARMKGIEEDELLEDLNDFAKKSEVEAN